MTDFAITADGRLLLRSAADADGNRVRNVANQLEGVFIQQLMQSLDDHSLDDEPLFGDSPAQRQFDGLFHGALSERMSGHLGVADAVFAELATRAKHQAGAAAPSAGSASGASSPTSPTISSTTSGTTP